MKKIDNLVKMLMALSVFICCYACDSNDENTPNPTTTTVTAESLNGYYIPYQDETSEGKQSYRVVSFFKENGTMMAYLDGQGVRRGYPLIINNNQFIFDINADNSNVLTFSFTKDVSGNITLLNLTKTGGSTLTHYEMFSPSQIPSWGGFIFERVAGEAGFFKYYRFSANKTLFANDVSPNAEPNQGCYELGNGFGFKSNGELIMGIFVPSWKGNSNVK